MCGGGACKCLRLSRINDFSCPGLKGVISVPVIMGRHSADAETVSRGEAFTVTGAGQKCGLEDERKFT